MKYLRALLYFFCFMALPSLKAEELKCIQEGQLRLKSHGEEKIVFSSYCFNGDKNILKSKNCLNDECIPTQKLDILTMEDIFSMSSSPGFSLCQKIDGHPFLVEFLVEGKWYALDKCVFSNKSFVDTGYLVGTMLMRKK